MNIGRSLKLRLCAWVEFVSAHAAATVAVCAALSVAAVAVAVNSLGINSDTIKLFPEDLPARRNHDAFVAIFPNLENALLVVIDADTPELAREAAEGLTARLLRDRIHFEDVYLPGGGAFFERNALLYRSIDELDRFGDQLARLQPVVAELERDNSIAAVASLVREGLGRRSSDEDRDALWSDILDRIGRASVEVYRENPLVVSWEDVILRGSSLEVVTRRVIVALPILDFSAALPAAESLAAIRSAAHELGYTGDSRVRVRLTGNPALAHEETLSLARDIGVSGLVCLIVVCGILTLALRSLALVAATITTLLVGLTWTAAFAALAVGDLNVISVAAGVLFLGLGVDFGIHMGMRYADDLRTSQDHASALRSTTHNVGGSLVLCTATTAIGFFAFLPTDYRGVAELGLITGVGLIIILFLTLTLIPALLGTLFRVDPLRLRDARLRFRGGAARSLTRFTSAHRRAIRRLAVAAALAGLALLPRTRFDANIVAMRDPSTESVRAFNDLLADSGASSPWYANSVAPDLAGADVMKRELAALAVVDRAVTLSDYIPEDQQEKLEILADVAFLMDSGNAGGRPERPDAAAQVEALRELHAFLGDAGQPPRSSSLGASILDLRSKLGAFLRRVGRDPTPEPALADLEKLLLSSLPAHLDRLHQSLAAEEITRADLPERLVRRMITPDGRARIQTFPSENLVDEAAFSRFVDGVQAVDPQATGVAVNLVAFARTTRQAFAEALAGALLMITAILWLLWRNPREIGMVLAPLFLSAILTGAAMVLLEIPLNFFNVVVIPLLLGAGVDTGIHLVERARGGDLGEGELLGTTTARAVFYSALTTITSFGSLGLSTHIGLSGLGTLLTVGMLLTVFCNLVVLPALLAAGPSAQT